MQTPKNVADEVEGNQNVDGESVKFGKLRNISDKEYAADVAALKKKYNVRDGVSNMVFNDQYALMDPATGKLLTTSDFDKAAAAQSNGFRLMAGQEDDGLLTIYRSAFAADIEQVNIGGSIGFTDFRLKAGYETALFTVGHELGHMKVSSVQKLSQLEREVMANGYGMAAVLRDKGVLSGTYNFDGVPRSQQLQTLRTNTEAVLKTMQALTGGKKPIYSTNAVNMLVETAIHESDSLQHRIQIGDSGKPLSVGIGGLGLFQMEKVTFNDLNDRYMPEFQPGVESAMSELFGNYRYSDLQGNDALATAFARMKYFSLPSSIPGSRSERADYWGEHYGTIRVRSCVLPLS
jgi:hypothetical protein